MVSIWTSWRVSSTAFMDSPAADGDHRLLAARHGSRELLPAFGEPGERGEHLVEVLLDDASVLFEVGAEPQVLDDREAGKDFATLGNAGDSLGHDPVRLQPGEVPPAEEDAPAPWRRQPEDGTDERRLPGTVRAEQAG